MQPWTFDAYLHNATHFVFDLEIPLKSYLGIGFGTSMFGSDMIVMIAHQNGTFEIFDMWSEDYEVPILDEQQDVKILSYTANSTYASVKICRSLETGDKKDFHIFKNREVDLMWAFVQNVDHIASHSMQQRGLFKILFKTVELTTDLLAIEGRQDIAFFFRWHGYCLTLSWNVFAFIMIFTNRYMKYFNHNNYMIHVFTGTLMGGFTFFYTFFASQKLKFNMNYQDRHHLIGAVVPLLLIAVGLTGKLARDRMFAMQRNHREIIPMRQRHATLGWTIIVISQGAILTGVYKYYSGIEQLRIYQGYFLLVVVEVLILYGFEFYIQKINSSKPTSDHIKKKISQEQFSKGILSGQQYVLLDDLVLDVSNYKLDHPGGLFLLHHNIGQDISKFFYGGYTYENYIPDKSGHIHSNAALSFAINKLAVAKLDKQGKIQGKYRIVERKSLNTTTSLIRLQSKKTSKQTLYSILDINTFGLHYLLSSSENPNHQRQYSFAHSLNPDIYQQNLRLIKQALDNSKDIIAVEKSYLTSDIYLTVKNYSQGLSSDLHNASKNDEFNINGLYGLGLGIYPSNQTKLTGNYLIFAGGTGIIPFLDLLSYILWYNLGLIPEQSSLIDGDFKIHLHCSFREKNDYIGQELIEGLKRVNQIKVMSNFQVKMRDQNNKEWEKDYLQKAVEQAEGKVNKIWVCGPPKMNESFNIFFNQLKKQFKFKNEILSLL
ncbi:cytochrome b5-like heme steroid binding domain containing protein [Stylonychia lemnae]|uniref:Cytochrome b5-like heme steroid binding domain containing protein n=1 Tax=Stylonychia lemnae TaxID=5949 RepID=A0A078B6V0_STYLE|nr:cytochrome b5-like heme steroid binding domain containing protein [Stylonychia lemnae]|eukprot:CDW90265.1 cytochrome b5-like heme steroid binding domain containing protein [Stylonychia lemnae]